MSPHCWFLVRAFGIESHVLTPAESKELYPLLDADNFYASLYRYM